MKLKQIASAGILLLLVGGTARADDFSFYSSDGPMDIHVGPSGQVTGQYQQDTGAGRPGRLIGSVSGGGTLEGLWLQPVSDHPCSSPREGVNSWGRFTISNAWGPNPYGIWGYCDEIPSRPWNLQRR